MSNVKNKNIKNNNDLFFNVKVNKLKYTFCSIGASIYSIEYDNNLLTLTPKDKDFFIKSPQFFGKTLGLVAGRIKSEFKYNNQNFKFNETHPGLSLHGGYLNSISFEDFKYKIKEYKNKIDVIFTHSPRKGKNGFNSKINLKIIYSLNKLNNSFKIREIGYVKDDSFLNLSNHIYWNLSKDKTINDYKLKFDSIEIGTMNEELLIIGKEKTPEYLNFNRKTKLKSRLDIASKTSIGTIDHTFIFNKNNKINKCLLENKNYILKLSTDLPAMNIYCDSSLTDVKFLNRDDLYERRGIALEPQLFNLDLDSIYFKKGEKFDHYIKYQIIKK